MCLKMKNKETWLSSLLGSIRLEILASINEEALVYDDNVKYSSIWCFRKTIEVKELWESDAKSCENLM